MEAQLPVWVMEISWEEPDGVQEGDVQFQGQGRVDRKEITEAKGMVREARERDCKYRSEATGGVI